MKDFPFFPTQFGIAGLTLQEIPTRGEAYIQIRDCTDENLKSLVQECSAFCRMAGAETVYVTGHAGLDGLYEVGSDIIEMRGNAEKDTQPRASLFPVTAETSAKWRTIYNDKMRAVPHAKMLTSRDEPRLCESGAYFIHESGQLLGIGWLENGKILALAAVVPGAGAAVAQTLLSLAEEENVTLEVAAENHRAIRLYEKLGFLRTRCIRRWYLVN